jgi:cyclomaltodextrinase / maltogenic alpha-amylase / neopullulanase
MTGEPALPSMVSGPASYKNNGVAAMSNALRLRARVLLLLGCALATLLPLTGVARAATATDYSRLPARSSPEWVHDAVIYEIFPRQFSAQGDFNGVTAQLDRLQQLGVTVLWLMPIHPVGKLNSKGTLGSPYAVRDYYGINPEYGTAADLHRLVSEAHKRKLKLIIDIVANHTSWDSVMMKTPAFYRHDAGGKIIPPMPDWSDVAQLNYDNAQLRRYMIDMLKHWITEFDLDGFRCDAAGMVPTDFWEQARTELSALKPDIVMLAEWDDPALTARAFDLDYSWKLYGALGEVLEGRAPASAVREQWSRDAAQYERGALRMRFSDNHDQDRAVTRFGQPAALAASALMFTLDGVPLLYDGMEVGDTAESGAPALFEKLPILWSIAERRPQFPRFYKQIIALRKAHPALRGGDVAWVHNSDEQRILTFMRHSNNETVLVAINLSSQPFVGVAEAGASGYEEITPELESGRGARNSGLPALALGAWEYRVFRKQQ